MPRFFKGIYAFTEIEVLALIEAYKNKQFIEIGNKQFIPLYTKKKGDDISRQDFEELVFTKTKKKDIYLALNTTQFKLDKFLRNNYGTCDLAELRVTLKTAN
jgi:hypothetical protein